MDVSRVIDICILGILAKIATALAKGAPTALLYCSFIQPPS